MKASTIVIFVITILYGCSQSEKDIDPSGVYVTQFKNEYSVTDDTLIVKKINSGGKTYKIERRTGFNKIRNGETNPREYKVALWNATLDIANKSLKETEFGKQIFIAPNNILKIGNSAYHKVK